MDHRCVHSVFRLIQWRAKQKTMIHPEWVEIEQRHWWMASGQRVRIPPILWTFFPWDSWRPIKHTPLLLRSHSSRFLRSYEQVHSPLLPLFRCSEEKNAHPSFRMTILHSLLLAMLFMTALLNGTPITGRQLLRSLTVDDCRKCKHRTISSNSSIHYHWFLFQMPNPATQMFVCSLFTTVHQRFDPSNVNESSAENWKSSEQLVWSFLLYK